MVPSANSCRLVLPTNTAPASRRRATTVGVAVRDVAVAHARGGGRRRAVDVEDVLQRDRNAVQRPAIAARRQLPVRRARLCERLVGEHGDERVDRRIAIGDLLQAAFGDGFRGDLARPERARQLGNRPRLSGHPGSGARRRSPVASPFQSAMRSDDVARASVSSSGFRAGEPRRSASWIAFSSHTLIVMVNGSRSDGSVDAPIDRRPMTETTARYCKLAR